MKQYKIPVIWECWGLVRVEANSLEEAKEKAIHHETPLPDGDYIEDSQVIDEEGVLLHNPEEE